MVAVCEGPGVKVGGCVTGVTLMTSVAAAEVFWPPLAVPPLSIMVTVSVALPLTSGAN